MSTKEQTFSYTPSIRSIIAIFIVFLCAAAYLDYYLFILEPSQISDTELVYVTIMANVSTLMLGYFFVIYLKKRPYKIILTDKGIIHPFNLSIQPATLHYDTVSRLKLHELGYDKFLTIITKRGHNIILNSTCFKSRVEFRRAVETIAKNCDDLIAIQKKLDILL